jgi:NAD-dependent SIR2 family protein deacetylase
MNSLLAEIQLLQTFIADHPALVILTGAGISAPSGIPTYRDRHGQWRHSAPITHQEFIADRLKRQRYWARSLRGWPVVRDARPNVAHLALARLERLGFIRLLITQNVDRLHQRAGSQRVEDLHGRVDRVRCLRCLTVMEREQIQLRLLRDNPGHGIETGTARPDGDADVADDLVSTFSPPDCEQCRGTLMPDVVFFGGSVPPERVRTCLEAVAEADALLVVGSSLQVYSGLRFCRHAVKLDKPVAIINPGTTRGDDLAHLKLQSNCEPLLAAVAEFMQSSAIDESAGLGGA